MNIRDPQGHELGLVKEKIITFLPKFELYEGGRHIGRISKKLSLFSPKFSIDFNGWQVEGNFLEWDYTIGTPGETGWPPSARNCSTSPIPM